VEGGVLAWTVHDPLRGDYYRHDPLTHDLCELLDGERTVPQVREALQALYPQYLFNDDYVVETVAALKKGGFLDDTFQMNEIQLARAREARKRLSKESLRNVLNIQFGIVDPTPLFRVLYPIARITFSLPFVLGMVAAFAASVGILWNHRDVVIGHLRDIYTLGDSSVFGLFVLYAIFFGIVVAHEFGHGLCCMHFGGQPKRLGFLLMYFMPGMFCDVSDIYFFENRWHRAAVALAGGYVEIMFFVAATFIWVATPPDLLVHAIAYRVMLFSFATGLVFNYNPLIKLDGYYVLMSWLDIQELRERSFRYLGDLFRKYVLRLPVTPEVTTRRERRALFLYGAVAFTYSVFYAWVMLLFVRKIFVGNFREAGFVAFALFFFYFTRKYWKAGFRGARYLALERGGFVRRHVALTLGGVGLFVLLLLVPLPRALKLEGHLEPATVEVVRAPHNGRIEAVFAHAGAPVRPGAVLAVLGSTGASSFDTRVFAAAAAGAEAVYRRATDPARGTGGDLSPSDGEGADEPDPRPALPVARARWAEAQSRERSGWLVAHTDGIVLSTMTSSLLGRSVAAGDSILRVGGLDTLEIVLDVSEREVVDLASGYDADFRLRADPSRRVRFRIGNVALSPQDRPVLAMGGIALANRERPPTSYRATAIIVCLDRRLRPGMSGIARVEVRPLNLIQRGARLYARLVRADFWL
jgi:putative peptide zinc metalloprotease protein